jgi:hypothetical protein
MLHDALLTRCVRITSYPEVDWCDTDFRGLIHKEFTPTLFPVTGEVGQTHCISRMPPSSGDKPNPYEILEPVGAGGLGGTVTRGGGFLVRP